MPHVVVAALKAHRKGQLEERLAAGAAWHDSALVFVSPVGTPLDARNVSRVFDGMLQAAKLPHVRFHDLRHTAATLLLAQGVDPRTIMETLGHSQISLTLNTYAHVQAGAPGGGRREARRDSEPLGGQLGGHDAEAEQPTRVFC